MLLGGNLGDRFLSLEKAILQIEKKVGFVEAKSGIYETEAWGKKGQPEFLNQVVCVKTTLPPEELLKSIQQIEKEIGRVRYDKWGARIIDIDILFYNDQIIESKDLTIPHPLMPFRKFALIPLKEICNGLIHPVFKVDINKMLENCPDELSIKLVKEVSIN